MELSQRFKIEHKLGSQRNRKFGNVFLVTDTTSKKKGVLKAAKKESESKILVERVMHEGSFDFNFPGLPKTLAIYDSENEYILIREYVEGITLEEAWNSTKKKDRHNFLAEVLSQLAVILNRLKELSIVHCDIKPGNILISPDLKVHLIDFGIALHINSQETRETLFPLGYAAPELLLNRLHLVDHRTDYFALGVLIWKLYAGKLPLTHPNPSIFTNLQLTHPLPESSDVPKKIQRLLEKLSAKHQFSIPPNKMKLEYVDEGLMKGMNSRYIDLNEFVNDFKAAKPFKLF